MTRGEVLVILRNAASRRLWEEVVEGQGYTVRYVRSEQEALRLLSHEEIDVVVVDGRGEGGGVSVVEAITRLRPHQSLLLVSPGESWPESLAANPRLVALSDPVRPAHIRHEMERLVESTRLLRENSQLISENYQQMRQVDLVRRIQEVVSRADRDQAVSDLLSLLMAEVGASRGAVVCPREKSDEVRVLCQSGFSDPTVLDNHLRWEQGYLGTVLARGVPTLLQRGEAPSSMTEEEGHLMGPSCLLLPLTIREQVTGGVILCARTNGELFSSQDLHLIQGVTLPLASLLSGGESSLPSSAEKSPLPGREDFRDQKAVEEILSYEVLKGSRHGRPFALLLFDFGTIRDQGTEGHTWMPLPVAHEVRRTLGRVLRATDVVARMDKGEVAVFAPETDYHGAITVVRRIRQIFQGRGGAEGSAAYALSYVGCGIACYPQHAVSVSDLITRARESLARSEGNRYLHYPLWEFVATLLDEAERSAEVGRLLSQGSRRVGVMEGDMGEQSPGAVTYIGNPEEFTLMTRFIEQEACKGVFGEGVLYVGMGLLSNLRPHLDTYYAVREQGIGVYLFFGKDDWTGWDPRGLVTVAAVDPEMLRYRFIFYYGVSACYGLIGRSENGEKFRGLFTTRPSLVNECIKKIKQLYPVKE